MSGWPDPRTKATARILAKALTNIGYNAEAADHELAVKIFDADGKEISIVWLPLGEPTPTGLGDLFLWGPSGDEHRAPDDTGVRDLVQEIARTLQ